MASVAALGDSAEGSGLCDSSTAAIWVSAAHGTVTFMDTGVASSAIWAVIQFSSAGTEKTLSGKEFEAVRHVARV